MPAFYAHYCFGERVRSQLDAPLQALIQSNLTAFEIGLQGPDVFFFYKPWKKNELVSYGNGLHELPAKNLFMQGMHLDRNSASYAYMLGVACHYALDSTCHPFVSEHEQTSGVSHMEIESEFEKMLLRRNDHNPFTYRVDLLIPTDRNTANAIYEFYEMFHVKQYRSALYTMQFFRNLFTEPHPIKQRMMNGLLDTLGFGKYKAQILQLNDNPLCARSNATLYQLFEQALPLAVTLLAELDYCKQYGTALSEKWDNTFA